MTTPYLLVVWLLVIPNLKMKSVNSALGDGDTIFVTSHLEVS